MQMIRAYVETKGFEGHYAAIVLARKGRDVELLIPSYLEKVTMPADRLDRCPTIAYRPTVVRRNLLARVAEARKAGRRFPKAEVRAVLGELGAGARTVTATMNAEMCPAAVEKTARRKAQAVRAAETRAAAASIADRVTYRLTTEAEVERAARVRAEADRRSIDALNGVAMPKPGTGARRLVETLLADGPGSTNAELCACYGYAPGTFSFSRDIKRYALKYGLAVATGKNATGTTTYRLVRSEEAEVESA